MLFTGPRHVAQGRRQAFRGATLALACEQGPQLAERWNWSLLLACDGSLFFSGGLCAGFDSSVIRTWWTLCSFRFFRDKNISRFFNDIIIFSLN